MKKTHTVRWNRDKTLKIMTFSTEFFSLLSSSHPMSVALFIDEVGCRYQKMQGLAHIINPEQYEKLEHLTLENVTAINKMLPVEYAAYKMFTVGYLSRASENDMKENLAILNYFFTTMLSQEKE